MYSSVIIIQCPCNVKIECEVYCCGEHTVLLPSNIAIKILTQSTFHAVDWLYSIWPNRSDNDSWSIILQFLGSNTLLLYAKFNDILIQTHFKNLIFLFGTQDSVDSMATATSWTNKKSFLTGGKRFLSSQKRPDQLWDVPTLQRQPGVLFLLRQKADRIWSWPLTSTYCHA
jgi:hypothetical protein